MVIDNITMFVTIADERKKQIWDNLGMGKKGMAIKG